MFRGKNYKESAKLIDKQALYDPKDAFDLVCKASKAKFDETVELHVKLGVDSRHADQQVRGAIVLPNGTGKTLRVLVFCKPEREEEAKAAGADYAGGQDLVQKIQTENWFEFDTVIASPDMMGVVGRLGKLLGPKGLMPSPKAGTVTPNLTQAITEAKAAGADYAGGQELVQKIQSENWFEFDTVIASPDMMGVVGRLGKLLGPKGLMPSPKAGTVTPNIAQAISEAKAGKIEYRLDKTNIIHCPIGKVSFGAEKLVENYNTLISAIIRAKPAAAKGQYIKSCVTASTMGPGVKINANKQI